MKKPSQLKETVFTTLEEKDCFDQTYSFCFQTVTVTELHNSIERQQ